MTLKNSSRHCTKWTVKSLEQTRSRPFPSGTYTDSGSPRPSRVKLVSWTPLRDTPVLGPTFGVHGSIYRTRLPEGRRSRGEGKTLSFPTLVTVETCSVIGDQHSTTRLYSHALVLIGLESIVSYTSTAPLLTDPSVKPPS